MLGFQQAGDPSGLQLKMQFYSGDHGGRLHHHDIAFIEVPSLPDRLLTARWSRRSAISPSPLAREARDLGPKHLQITLVALPRFEPSPAPARQNLESPALACPVNTMDAIRKDAQAASNRVERRPGLRMSAHV
jgi:hypothetical protein